MGEQMNRLLILRLLNEARKDLKKLNKINIEAIPYNNVKEYARFLRTKKQEGFGRIELFEFGLMEEKAQFMNDGNEVEDISISDLTEIFSKIEEMYESNDFDFLLKQTGLSKAAFYEPFSESLAALRASVQDMIDKEFTIPGFPLPIVPGKMNLVVAPSHSGKTFYAMGLAITLARKGYKVAFISTEEDLLSFGEKTLAINENDPLWANIFPKYIAKFDSASLMNTIAAAQELDFVVIDYLKKSMWNSYTSDHMVMEDINSTILNTLAAMERKVTVFACIQSNREGYKKTEDDIDVIQNKPQDVAMLIDGGMPAYRSADNVVFLWPKKKDERYAVVCKARRNNDILGRKYSYNVNPETFNIEMGVASLFDKQKKNIGGL
jgi:hypothetical protein